jgi:hypothetical protein
MSIWTVSSPKAWRKHRPTLELEGIDISVALRTEAEDEDTEQKIINEGIRPLPYIVKHKLIPLQNTRPGRRIVPSFMI